MPISCQEKLAEPFAYRKVLNKKLLIGLNDIELDC